MKYERFDTTALARAINEAFRDQINATAAEPLRGLRFRLPRVKFNLPDPEELLAKITLGLDNLQERLRSHFPRNWRGLDELSEYERALAVGTESGISLIWAPRIDIVRELSNAAAADRDAILIARETEILEDLQACLDETIHADLATLRQMAQEALDAHKAGLHGAAQSLTAVGLAAVMRDILGQPKFGAVRQKYHHRNPMFEDIQDFRIFALLRLLARAITDTRTAGPGFNRHAIVHYTDPHQLTQANALSGLLLFVGLLREFHYWFALDDEPEARA